MKRRLMGVFATAACVVAGVVQGQDVGAGGASAGVNQGGQSQTGTSGASTQAGPTPAAGVDGPSAGAGVNAQGQAPRAGISAPGQGQADGQGRAEWSADTSNRVALGVTLDSRGDQVIVGRVLPNSPAAEIGLRTGDVIVSIDDEPVRSADQFTTRVRGFDRNGRAKLVILRDGQQQTMDAHFMAWNEVFPQPYTAMRPQFEDAPLPADAAPLHGSSDGASGACCATQAYDPGFSYGASYGYASGGDCCGGRPRRARRCCW